MSTLASVVLKDVAANKPAAAIAGRVFYETDTGKIWRDNGASWDDVTPTAGGTGLNFANSEVPGGLVNGSNTAFTLAHSPNPAASLQLYLNGQRLTAGAGADYTLSGSNITMASAPLSGDVLIADYRY